MLLDEIGTRLSTQSIASSSGEGGWYLYKSMLPDSTVLPDKAVALIETAGGPPRDRVDLDQPGFQVLVRGQAINAVSSAYEDARQKIEDVKQDLHAISPGSLSGRHYPGIWAEQEPFLLEYDANQRPVLACNFRAFRTRTT